jgi:EAL domain-containing protein (putative c-di-GMP-specific phosphodiesterase class I)/GGDEF domain-containing protein
MMKQTSAEIAGVQPLSAKRGLYRISLAVFSLSCIALYGEMLVYMDRKKSLLFCVLLVLLGAAQLLLVVLFLIEASEERKPPDPGSIDPLTGLPTEARLTEVVIKFLRERAVSGEMKGKNSTSYSIVCLELVFFRRFSALLKDAVDDELLRIVGDTLRKNCFCTVRNSGPRFTLLAPAYPTLSFDLANDLSAGILDNLGRQYADMTSFRFGILPLSGEVATNPSERAVREAYAAARMALSYALDESAANSVTYDQSLKKRIQMERNIELRMLHALSGGEFLVYVQPKYHLVENTCTCGEALIRWNAEEMGFIMPDTFIPIFERNGFIAELDFFVLTFIFQHIQSELSAGKKVLPISVNQSKVTLAFSNYMERLQNLIRRYPIPLRYIDLEVTESAMEDDSGSLLSYVYAIKELGFSISLDDFGSAYSSLNTLQGLPVDTLKIDKEFIARSRTYERSKIIVRNIINMAGDLGMEVVCEGVETREQTEFLRDCGCDYAQGFYYAPSMPFEEYKKTYLTN